MDLEDLENQEAAPINSDEDKEIEIPIDKYEEKYTE
jgi:hypothetical protein